MKNYQESLKNIISKLDKELTVEERMNLLKQQFPKDSLHVNDDFKAIIEYVNVWKYGLQHGQKRKNHPLYENTYLAKGLSIVGDFVLDKWGEYEKRDVSIEDNTIQSKYDITRLAKAGEHKQIVGFDTSVADDFLENGVTINVLNGLECHVDMLEKSTKRADDIFNFSEDAKRAARKQSVLDNLKKYPVLYERYIAYKEMGLRYGFDESLSPEQKEEMKQKWINHFAEETDHPVKQKDRYYRLLKMYNEIGYELSKVLEQFTKIVKPRPSKQVINHTHNAEDNQNSFVLEMFDLRNPNHVNGLLSVQKGVGVGEYYPLYRMLKDKHGPDSDFGMIVAELNEVLQVADLSELEGEIVNMIIGEHNYNIFSQPGNTSPYDLIASYINEKYRDNKTKTDIMKLVQRKISVVISNTYQDLENGIDLKKCTKCKVEKLASTNNFGEDTRKKDGLKSACRKCAAKSEKKRKQIV